MSEYIVPIAIEDIPKITKTLTDFQLKAGNPVVYKQAERSNTPYLRINANCSLCQETCKYVIVLSKDPFECENYEPNKKYLDLQITVSNKHDHSTVNRITGDKRETIAMEIKLKHNGSAEKYRSAQIAKGLQPSSSEVYRKIHSEFNQKESMNVTNNYQIINDDNISIQEPNDHQELLTKAVNEAKLDKPKYYFDFFSNIISVSECLNISIKGNKLNGYVRDTSTYPNLKICTWRNN
ncbi:unnamed protein product [Brachionus calyciflorus]|uniref:Uncharacterized protein n=1 Tax=Brachionus calyciflorus TaxID=104777 RepID=A0A813T1A8_9BILA|nr:unnamed protein product [Brachionus calyciflorus]